MKVTVIIPLHQAAATITATLDSLAAQGDVDLEVIVVDDRSTDGGPDLARRHPLRPRVVASGGAGPSATRNAGVALATGDVVVFLDADDLLKPDALPARLRALRALPPDTVLVSRHADLLGDRERPARFGAPLNDDPRAILLRTNLGAIFAFTVPRGLLARLAGPFDASLRQFEDWDLWLRLAFTGARFAPHDVVDGVYRQRARMTLHDRGAADAALLVLARGRALVAGLAPLERGRLERQRRRGLHHYLTWRASLAVRRGDVVAALLDLGRAARASPREMAALPRRVVARGWRGITGR